MKVKEIKRQEVIDYETNKPVPAIVFNNGCKLVFTECWFTGHNYNSIHNYYAVEFNGFFIEVPLRKPRNGYMHTKKSLDKEIVRANKKAKEIIENYIRL